MSFVEYNHNNVLCVYGAEFAECFHVLYLMPCDYFNKYHYPLGSEIVPKYCIKCLT